MAKTETARAPKGTGTSVSAELKDFPELLQKIRAAAKIDRRPTSVFFLMRVLELDKQGLLLPTEGK